MLKPRKRPELTCRSPMDQSLTGQSLVGRRMIVRALLGLGLLVLPCLPVAAQSWPSDSGPSGDHLGATMRLFERLGPPPVEEGGRAERVIPGMPVTDVPGGSVDVGMPAVVPPARSSTRRAAPRREARRPVREASVPRRRARDGDSDLRRELESQGQRIRELERQLRESRTGVSGSTSAAVTPR